VPQLMEEDVCNCRIVVRIISGFIRAAKERYPDVRTVTESAPSRPHEYSATH